MKYCTWIVALITTFSLMGCGGGNANFTTTHPPPPTHDWTWVNGSNVVNQPGSYGTQGTASATNVPGARALAFSWIDTSETFWLFGGISTPTQQSDTFFNDLWKCTAGQWTWEGGSSTPNQPGVYGTQGVAAAGNIPGARESGASWTDQSGNFWLFGGLGLDANGRAAYLNDLWKFSAGQWTWMGGSNTGAQVGVYGTQGLGAASNIPGGRQPAASWIDTAGNFWLFGGVGYDSTGKVDYLNDLWEYTGGQWIWISGSNVVDQPGSYGTEGVASSANVPGSRLEALSWSDASGNLWLFGGSPGPDGQFHLFNDLWRFSAGDWTWAAGSNTEDQIGNYGLEGTASVSNVPGARVSSMTWTDSSGNLWLLGGDGEDASNRVGQLNDLWKFDGSQWTWVGGSNAVNQSGSYGTLGMPATGNIPGARTWAATWTDSSGNFWLFGGNGYDSTGKLGYLNDLWEYQP